MKNDIIKLINQSNKYVSKSFIDLITAYLIILKYLCEKNELNLEEVIQNDNVYEITYGISVIGRVIDYTKIPINSLLIKYTNQKAKDLLIEFIKNLDKPIKIHNENDNVIYMDIDYKDFDLYGENGNITYCTTDKVNKDINYYGIFKYFDEILGVKNNYLYENEINFKNYNYLYIFNNIPRFRFDKNDSEYNKIRKYMLLVKNVVLYTNYLKIRNFNEGKHISNYISKIILNDKKALLIFNVDSNNEISIINYNTDKIDNDDELRKIINNNRKQKGILVKIKNSDLKENNYRIGFNLYQLEKNDEIKDINSIVDENTKYLEELNKINSIVEREIDLLLNK